MQGDETRAKKKNRELMEENNTFVWEIQNVYLIKIFHHQLEENNVTFFLDAWEDDSFPFINAR